jgi:large subunit ribosomal protein L53
VIFSLSKDISFKNHNYYPNQNNILRHNPPPEGALLTQADYFQTVIDLQSLLRTSAQLNTMKLQQITRILIQYSPYVGKTTSIKEFLTQISCKSARLSNPDCKVDTVLRLKGDPFIELTYENSNVERIETSGMTVLEITKRIQEKMQESDMKDLLEAVKSDKLIAPSNPEPLKIERTERG